MAVACVTRPAVPVHPARPQPAYEHDAFAFITKNMEAIGHGALRHLSGFDLNQLGAEYRALRASVIRLWTQTHEWQMDSAIFDDVIRFNEAIDQAVAESTSRYAAELRSPLSAINMLSHMLGKSATTDAARSKPARSMFGLCQEAVEEVRSGYPERQIALHASAAPELSEKSMAQMDAPSMNLGLACSSPARSRSATKAPWT